MIKFFLLLGLVVGILAAPKAPCDPATCKLPNCRCFGTDTPGGLPVKDIPQLVYFTFDDAVQAINHDTYYQQAFYGKKNPNGCQIASTYFISHEYTDYGRVHRLHANGQEVALHSISHVSNTAAWKGMSVEDLQKEFDGQVQLISKFANVPAADIKGMRMPFLQLAGDNSFEMIQKSPNLIYDCSWPTTKTTDPALWPYTLDSQSEQDCPITPCPTKSLPGVWVSPMVSVKTEKGMWCSMADSCTPVPDTEEGVLDFMKSNFLRHYNGNKAPFGWYIHSSWFAHEHSWGGYLKFIDYLQSLKDVYIVSVADGLEWVRNPQTLTNLDKVWPECRPTYTPTCSAKSCQLVKESTGETRYMPSCTECPRVYPWVGNPLGV